MAQQFFKLRKKSPGFPGLFFVPDSLFLLYLIAWQLFFWIGKRISEAMNAV